MSSKPIMLGTRNRFTGEVTDPDLNGADTVEHLRTDGNFLQITLDEKVDVRINSTKQDTRLVFRAYFVEANSLKEAPMAQMTNSGWSFFADRDEKALLGLILQLHRANGSASRMGVFRHFDVYESSLVNYRLTKNAEMLTPIVYIRHMLHQLASKKREEPANSSEVSYLCLNLVRDIDPATVEFFKEEDGFTKNRIALAMIENDLRTDLSLVDVQGMVQRHNVTKWLRDNMAVVKSCEEHMANEDYHALA